MTLRPPGEFSTAIAGLASPPVPVVQQWARSYDGAIGPLIDLSQAVPGYPPHPDLLTWIGQEAGSIRLAGYGPIEGEPELRDAYAAHVAALYAADIGPANTHITAGCNQAFVAALMAVAGAGDTVLMTNPCYFNHASTLEMLGIGRKFVDCHPEQGFVPDLGAIDRQLTPEVRAFAVVTPNNPTGATYPPEFLADLYALCRGKGVWLVIDETYRDFLAPETGRPHGLFDQVGWQDTVIQLYSFSKSFCIPGHRLGAITGGEPLIAEVAKIMDNLQICAPRAAQVAVARGLKPLAPWRAGNAEEIASRAAAFGAALEPHPDWRIDAMGAYFAYLHHPFEGKPSRLVAERLARQAGITCLPGEFFGSGQDSHLRIAFANADVETIGMLTARLGLPLEI